MFRGTIATALSVTLLSGVLGSVVAAPPSAGVVRAPTSLDVATAAVDEPRRMMFGGHAGGWEGTRLPALNQMESQIGRQLDFVRLFELWDSPFPTDVHNTVINSDRVMSISVRAKRRDGSNILWRDISNAAPGSALDKQLQTWIQRIKAVGKPVLFTFHHEPETVANQVNGTNAEFIAAWRHVVEEFRAAGATNVEFTWIMTDYGFEVPSSDRRWAPRWYPGDAYVDYIAADAYNWSTCRAGISTRWKSLETVIRPLRDFAALHPDKQVLLTEWASAEQAGDKGAWIDAAAALFQQPGWEQFAGVAYFDRIDSNFPTCHWEIDSSPASLAAFTRMGQDPFYDSVGLPPKLPQRQRARVLDTDVDASGPATAYTTFTPVTSGSHPTLLEWTTSANLRLEVRRVSDNALVASRTDTAAPKRLALDLVAGTEYRFIVTAASGSAPVTLTLTLPVPVAPQPTPPQVTLSSPAPGAILAGETMVSAGVAQGTDPVASVTFLVDGVEIATDSDGTDGWSVRWDSRTVADGQRAIRARAIDTAGRTDADQRVVEVRNAAAPRAALVVAEPGSLQASEIAVRNRLLGSGHEVLVIDDGVARDYDASRVDAVWVLPSASTAVGDAFKQSTTPVVQAKPWLFDDLGMTGTATTQYGVAPTSSLDVVLPDHPMAAQRSGTTTITSARDNVSWGRPGAGAQTVSLVDTRPVMFAYRTGATLADGTVARGCRIAFPLYQTGPTRFTTDAWAMFDATAAWADADCS